MNTQCYARHLEFQSWNKMCSPSSRSLQSGWGWTHILNLPEAKGSPVISDMAPRGGIIRQMAPELSLDESTGISMLRKGLGGSLALTVVWWPRSQ